MKVTNMIQKDFLAAVKDIKLAILRAWAPCSEIRYLASSEFRHSSSDEIRQMACVEMGELGAA